MEISYSNISSNNQTLNTNEVQSQTMSLGKVQMQSANLEGFRAGKVFKGEILEIKGSQVSIGLENGQILNAKLEDGIKLLVGQKVSFEVESNTDSRLTIKLADDLYKLDPVLQKALQEANLPMTDRNLQMVNSMIKEGLSINKQSLTNMLKQTNVNQGVDIDTLVKMNKLGIETTKENIQQFENYKNYEHRIVKDIDNVANHLPEALKEVTFENKDLGNQLQHKLLELLNSSRKNQIISDTESQFNHSVVNEDTNDSMNHPIDLSSKSTATSTITLNETADLAKTITNLNISNTINNISNTNNDISNTNNNISNTDKVVEKSTVSPLDIEITNNKNNYVTENGLDIVISQTDENGKANMEVSSQSRQLSFVLNEEQRGVLAEGLKLLGADESVLSQVKEGRINNNDLMNLIKTLVDNSGDIHEVENLFASKEYIEVLKQALKEKWLVEPKDLNEPDKISDYYKQLDEQTRQLYSLLESVGKDASPVAKDLTNIRNNLNFMEQINQNVTYLQIPVQFSNEETHSDLYVYTNKENLKNKDGNVSVLLHLDMEVLGTTDIYINMSGNQLSAKFSFQDNSAIELVEDNLEILVNRLKDKGYHMSASVTPIEKEQDFVEDFLEQDKVTTSLKRYAFDVRT